MEQSGFFTQLGEPLFTSGTMNIQVQYVIKFKIFYNKNRLALNGYNQVSLKSLDFHRAIAQFIEV